MKAKRRGKLVYTQRGYGAQIKSEPSPVTPVLVTTPTQVIHNPPAPVVPEEVCPHGGLLLGGKPVCGLCGDEEQQIGLAMLHIARKVSYRVPVVSSTKEDVTMTVVLALVANQNRILRAKNPTGLAFFIGKAAAIKMYRNRSAPSMAVSQMNFPDGPDLETTSQRLAFLDNQRVQTLADERWAQECYERARVFPGLDLVWNAKNFERLQAAIDEGKRDLPSTPINVWRVIDMRLGLSEGMPEHGWQEIADTISPSWKPIPEHQVRRTFIWGLAFLREHLVKTLVPQKIYNSTLVSKIDEISGNESI
jgi:hypothetical protein